MKIFRSLFVAIALALALAPVMALAAEPAVVSAPALQAGDTWVFDRAREQGTAGFAQRRVDLTIERLGTDTMQVGIKNDGAPTGFEDHMLGLDWSQRRLIGSQQEVTGRPFAFPMKVGSTWTTDFVDNRQIGLRTSAHFHVTYKVVGWEDVTVPAGTFHALKIEANGIVDATVKASTTAVAGGAVTSSGGTAISQVKKTPAGIVHSITYGVQYYVPEIKYYVKSIQEEYNSENVRTVRDTDSLVSFKAAH